MMVHFDQGPGRNIDFCLLTTGINIDPHHGCLSHEYYHWLKNVILQRAEIHFENQIIREIHDQDASSYLSGYNSTPRTVYQFLFGLVKHSNGWTESTLTKAIDKTPFFQIIDPQDEEYSIDFSFSRESGFTLFENLLVSLSNVWVEKQEFYYSNCKPGLQDGESGDVWFVVDGIDIELWYKPAFQWIRLEDHVVSQTPAGTITYSIADPGNTTNSWWLDLTGLNIRKYSVQLNSWLPATPVTVSSTPPGGLSNGDLWLKVDNGKFILSVFDGGISNFKRVKFNPFAVQDRNTNSAFVGTAGNNNFIIVCDDGALKGVPVSTGVTNLKVKKNNILIQSAVDCINFIGPDLDVTAAGAGKVDVEHLPVTTLPEQTSAPSTTTQSGKVFTLDVGGITELFYIDDVGNLVQLTNNGSTVQNIFLEISTTTAVPGQTIFSLTSNAKAVLTVKVNGVDTTAWSFTSPSVTYFPVGGGYVIQSGDVVTILYYE